MAPNIAVEAPTFHSLNKAQKRALMLRDQLRWTDIPHLNEFICGLSDNEPPAYKRINGAVYPPLVMVTLRPSATRYDLGNVHFDTASDQGPAGIYRAYLTVEDDTFELRTEDALKPDEANLETVPIHSFIAKTMVGLFEAKFRTIWERKNKINQLRRSAFEIASKAPVEEAFRVGQTLSRLDPERAAQNGSTALVKKAKKRRPSEPISKHSTNKRKHIGLNTIPEDAKTATFNAIPTTIKVDLFNNVIRTAFPNFDNLMMASWNVVSVYSNVGTDFPELHKSIVELKSVLQDFEESFGVKGKREDARYRRDLEPAMRQSEDESETRPTPTPDVAQHDGSDEAPAAPNGNQDLDVSHEQHNTLDALFEDPEPEPEPEAEAERDMPPPRLTQHRHASSDAEQPISHRTSAAPRLPSNDAEDPVSHRTSAVPIFPASTRSSPALPKRKRDLSSDSHELQRRRDEYRTAAQAPQESSDSDDDQIPPSAPKPKSAIALRARYNARKTELLRTFGSNANVPQVYRLQMQGLMKEIRAREMKEKEEADGVEEGEGGAVGEAEEGGGGRGENTGMPKFLGNSVLGGRKPLGMAPVAPMAHMAAGAGGVLRRESGGAERKKD
ncbi:hypothetical protein HBI46_125740 [Parastagonospora nodorum]|nr:hypothetical protein HBI79_058060 [Parastagonospora nodorum]KAH5054552.1 hypothetical protein HBH96_138550 [Parastagonospora nodorum]KAH5415810.1 hypothetical protein HBI46_125740 [Parastagonospora nodorum]